jgi:hypothetical protein
VEGQEAAEEAASGGDAVEGAAGGGSAGEVVPGVEEEEDVLQDLVREERLLDGRVGDLGAVVWLEIQRRGHGASALWFGWRFSGVLGFFRKWSFSLDGAGSVTVCTSKEVSFLGLGWSHVGFYMGQDLCEIRALVKNKLPDKYLKMEGRFHQHNFSRILPFIYKKNFSCKKIEHWFYSEEKTKYFFVVTTYKHSLWRCLRLTYYASSSFRKQLARDWVFLCVHQVFNA